MTSSDLSGKLVLVTGGAKNVGKTIARRFAERGAHVIINFFHSLDASKQTVAEFRAAGFQVDAIRASVAQQHQVDRMFDEIEARFGRLDILVNNAASGALLGIDEITEEHFDRALDINLKGAFWCARRAAALMARGGGGTIVNVSSAGASLVPANYLVVGTSKAALESLTRYLAVEYAARHIRVNTASATLIAGDVADLFPDPENTKRSSIAATPLKRLAQAEDLADLVVFLASGQSRWITGQTVLADGGLSLCNEGLSPRPEWAAGAPAPVPAPAPAPARAQAPGADAAPPAAIDDSDDIAVVGMGLALPGASDPDEFWRVLLECPELFGNVPPERWDYRSFYSPDPSARDKSYQSRSVFINDFRPLPRLQAEIDAGQAPAELTTLWLRHALMQALDGVALRSGDRTSFLVGYTADGSQHLEEAMVLAAARSRMLAALDVADATPEERSRCMGDLERALAERYPYGAQGLAEFFPHRVGLDAMRGVLPDDADYMMVDTACSSSLYSIDLGMKALLLDQQDAVACGGAFALAPRGSVLFSKLHGLSRSGEVRPLDQACDGVLFADGAGVVILKRLKRALADGDRVLGVLKAFGASSDGKGKAIYAPNSAGQNIAIERAYGSEGGADLSNIDWVVAHATGTPAGDMAEFESLRKMIVSDRPVQMTSNKSLVGHTGWAAGVTSLIQVLLGLRHDCIPPQHRFSAAPDAFRIDDTCLRIPTSPVAWPRKPSGPRLAAVSGFGFGGTNGHLVVSEYDPRLPLAPARRRDADAPLVIVGWSAKFPGLDGDHAVRDWLRGDGQAPLASFGDAYPLPPFERVRMSPTVSRVLDRCQLMALDGAHDLRQRLGDYWDRHTDRIGVIMGHMGPTRNAALYASRCYLDDMTQALAGHCAGPASLAAQALDGMRAATEALIAPSTENSFPGMMPNVIPARVANYHDLHGMNMTLDVGHASTLAAFEAAARYLRCGELDMAIVGGINGNSAAEIRPAFDAVPGEGLAMFAVMTEPAARAAGLAVLAHLDFTPAAAAVPQDAPRDRAGQALTYLGADGAVDVLRALLGAVAVTVTRANPGDQSRFALRVRPAAPAARIDPDLERTDVAADGQPLGVKRYAIELRETPRLPGGAPALSFFPPGCVLVTDAPELLAGVAPLPADLVVLSTRPLPAARPGWHHVAAADEATLAALVPAAVRHVRLLGDLRARALDPAAQVAASPALLEFHNLAFLALKRCYGALPDGSFIALLLDAVAGPVLHPDAGLFSGLVKAMGVEMPACRSLSLFTDCGSPAQAIAQAELESGARQLLPVVAWSQGRRLTPRIGEVAGTLRPADRPRLGRDSVVVAFGGARGITAELMKALAAHAQPTLYLIGSSRLDETMAVGASDEEFARGRAAYIRTERERDPGLPLPRINKAFDRLLEARTALRNIAAMRAQCGADRVHYLSADVCDPASVRDAVGHILAREAGVDLVVNAAGLNRSATVQVKSLADFMAVRDIKVRGYWNLRAAFGARQPAAWCNFGSFIGLTGQSGETDYAAANDFLNTQAAYRRAHQAQDEFTIGWTLWRSVGLGANPVTRAFLEKSGLFTSMSTAEGVHHFLRELNLAHGAANSVHLGQAERAAIVAHLPGFFDAAAAPTATAPTATAPDRRFYLGRTLERGHDKVVFERIFDLERDAYLAHHVVNGFATLPGTFVPEIAAEAALQLVSGLTVTGFEDVVFHHFLRVYDARRPAPKRIHAEVLQRDGDLVVVQVRVTGDVLAPTGQTLVRDKLHFELKVLLAPAYEEAPLWQAWPAAPFTAVADPYHFPAAPVLLTRMFVSTCDTGVTPLGKRARFSLDVDRHDPVFSGFVVPSIMLDGLARVAALNHVADDYIPLAAPASIRRIDIYEAGNDCELAARHAEIRLYATPREFALEGAGSRNRFVAQRPDGRMIMQMKDVTGVVIGYVHRVSGQFVPKAEVEALLAAAQGVPA